MSELYKDQIFWVETEKISPNPYQPRKEFNQSTLEDLADSVRQYGVMQPLTVTRIEQVMPEGGVSIRYELIAGERRLRASKIAGLNQVPVIIRKGGNDKEKLELAIIENLQREDLNAIDRALAFDRLAREFSLSHAQIGRKMGKSREYVSNSLRLLKLPSAMQDAIKGRLITEGHSRPLMMLADRPDQREILFQEIMYKKMSVREAERVARSIAKEKVRKKNIKPKDPKVEAFEDRFTKTLGTRVAIEKNRGQGGKIVIDYMTEKDLAALLEAFATAPNKPKITSIQKIVQDQIIKKENLEAAKELVKRGNESASNEAVGKTEIVVRPIELAAANEKQSVAAEEKKDDVLVLRPLGVMGEKKEAPVPSEQVVSLEKKIELKSEYSKPKIESRSEFSRPEIKKEFRSIDLQIKEGNSLSQSAEKIGETAGSKIIPLGEIPNFSTNPETVRADTPTSLDRLNVIEKKIELPAKVQRELVVRPLAISPNPVKKQHPFGVGNQKQDPYRRPEVKQMKPLSSVVGGGTHQSLRNAYRKIEADSSSSLSLEKKEIEVIPEKTKEPAMVPGSKPVIDISSIPRRSKDPFARRRPAPAASTTTSFRNISQITRGQNPTPPENNYGQAKEKRFSKPDSYAEKSDMDSFSL